jgi:hypothetical protein
MKRLALFAAVLTTFTMAALAVAGQAPNVSSGVDAKGDGGKIELGAKGDGGKIELGAKGDGGKIELGAKDGGHVELLMKGDAGK